MEAFVGGEYCSYSFLTSALDGVSGQRHAPAALYLRGKDPRYPLDRRLASAIYMYLFQVTTLLLH
jgi:hypothetical protein